MDDSRAVTGKEARQGRRGLELCQRLVNVKRHLRSIAAAIAALLAPRPREFVERVVYGDKSVLLL